MKKGISVVLMPAARNRTVHMWSNPRQNGVCHYLNLIIPELRGVMRFFATPTTEPTPVPYLICLGVMTVSALVRTTILII